MEQHEVAERDSNRKLKWLAVTTIAFLLLCGVAIFRLASTRPSKTRTVAIPQPNAYETLAQAAQQLVKAPEDFDSTDDIEALKECLIVNADTLALIDQSLGEGYLVTLDGAPGIVMFSQELARVLLVQSRVAQMEGRVDDAADPLVKIVLLGERLDEGGGLLMSLAAMAVEEKGATSLRSIADQLSDAKRAELLAKLEPAIGDSEDVDNVLKQVLNREEEFARAQQNLITGFWMRFASRDAMDRPKEVARQAMQRTEQQRDELLEALREQGESTSVPTQVRHRQYPLGIPKD